MHHRIARTPIIFTCGLGFVLLRGIFDVPLGASPLDHWTPRASPTGLNHLYGVTYGHGKFVVVGFASFLSSADGSQWIAGSFAGGQAGFGYAVTAGPDRFVAPGVWASIHGSTNGLDWVLQRAPTNVYALTGVAYGNGRYVIVGDAVLTSTDGTNWSVEPVTNRPAAVTFLNGWFLGGGYGQILRSTNGANWTRQSLSMDGWVNGIAYGRGLYVAVGSVWNPVAGASDCSILTSTNGLDWQRSAFFLRRELSSVAFGAGHFVAVGQLGTILVSHDGVSWASRDSGTSSNLKRVCYGNGTFVIVGEDGTILQSDPLLSLELVARPEVRLSVDGPTNHFCRIEYLDGLSSSSEWHVLTTVVLTNPPVICPDLTATNAARRFYRAVWVP